MTPEATTPEPADSGSRSVEESRDHTRLLVRVARLYHEQGMRQPQIASQLRLSQPRVSRLLKQAAERGIVRTLVVTPPGVHSELEEAIEQRFGLQEVVIADTDENDDDVIPALGAAAAVHLDGVLTGGDRIGISSWSATLLATVNAMRPRPTAPAQEVVQVLGGVGAITAQTFATRLTGRLAELVGGQAVYLPAPGLVASREARDALLADPYIAQVIAAYRKLSMVLVGIGSLDPSPLLRDSGNAVDDRTQDDLRRRGAVGDISLRFFDEWGRAVPGPLDGRVIGITLDDLAHVPRALAIAGGRRKYTAIRACARGRLVDALVTDLSTARRLADEPDGDPAP